MLDLLTSAKFASTTSGKLARKVDTIYIKCPGRVTQE